MLVLVRHGEAVARGVMSRDAARPLTPEGLRRFRRGVAGMRRIGIRLDLVLHSPWLRAVESADLLAPIVRGAFSVTPNLCRRPSRDLLDELRGRCVGAVGHEPWLSVLAAWLVTGAQENAPRFALRKGGVIALDGAPEPGAMRLLAAYPPKTLRRLGG